MPTSQENTTNFIYLNAFNGMGGIEKFNRALIESLLYCDTKCSFYSFYDQNLPKKFTKSYDFQYFPNKFFGVFKSFLAINKADITIIGHLNLSVLGVLSKFLLPKKKIIFIVHGIEIWQQVSFVKKLAVQSADYLLAVSEYSKQKLVEIYGIHPDKVIIFPNTLAADFQAPQQFDKPNYLLERYDLAANQKILFTLARLSFSEQYKGYDTVIATLPDLLAKHPDIHYVIAGKYDTQELERLRELSVLYNVEKYVTFTGFVADTEVQDHYLLADIFVMPSKGEGFGIVFIEAMACGVPVLAGNQDGSVDALLKGKVGSLVNPDDKTAIVMAIQELFTTHLDYTKKVGLQQTILQHFGFRTFIERTQKVLHLLR